MNDLKGKIALITGASQGIGLEVARCLSDFGVKVILTSRKSPEDLNKIVHDKTWETFPLLTLTMDVKNPYSIETVQSHLQQSEIALDILVNNAGVLLKEDVKNPNWQNWTENFEINAKGPAMVSYGLGPMMKEGSSIINICSIWGNDLPAFDAISYTASKAALGNITKSLALQFAEHGVRVNGISPGLVETEMTHNTDKKELEERIKSVPVKRLISKREIGSLVCFLASDLSSGVTGELIKIDGGLSLRI